MRGMPTTDANRELIRRYFALWNDPDLSKLDELDDILAPDIVDHAAGPTEPKGVAGLRATFTRWRTAFPDFVASIDDQIAEGDKVVTRWTLRGTHLGEYAGLAPSGRPVVLPAVSIDRIANGRITDEWYFADHLELLRQMRR
jgi:steroid delta-isomerase-like uncharacterized protein